jgi:hypothetical protein
MKRCRDETLKRQLRSCTHLPSPAALHLLFRDVLSANGAPLIEAWRIAPGLSGRILKER